MAGINDYSNTAGSNTTINGIDIAEGCSPAGINNAIRQLMADIADVDDGVVALQTPDINGGTIDGAVIGGTTPAAATFTSITTTGNILTSEGSATTPSLQLNDNDTGLFDAGANAIGFTTAGSEKVRIVQGGSVGIGTTNPAQKLHVEGSIYTSGNVGIGTSSPTDKLHVSSAVAAGVSFQATDTGGSTWRILSTDNLASISGGKLAFNNGSYKMVIDSSGSVGIGTTSPSSYYSDNLVISCPSEGGITLASQGTTQASYLSFADGTTGDQAYRGYIRYTHNLDALQFASAGTIRASFDSSGHLLPETSNTYDLGSTSKVWRNIYTSDFHMSNEGLDKGNDIDGTKGSWTFQEGEENLYLINNKNGKKYKFNLTEIE